MSSHILKTLNYSHCHSEVSFFLLGVILLLSIKVICVKLKLFAQSLFDWHLFPVKKMYFLLSTFCCESCKTNSSSRFDISRAVHLLFFSPLYPGLLWKVCSFLLKQLPGSVKRTSSNAKTATAFAASGTVMATMIVETTVMNNVVST